MTAAEAVVAVADRWAARGGGWTPRLRVGATSTGRVWVAMSSDEEHRHTGLTLADACEAWLQAHPAPVEGAA